MATYIRLTDYKSSDEKEEGFFKSENRYKAKQEDFEKIPESPIAYWINQNIKNTFENVKFRELTISEGKNITGNNDKYVRCIWEVEYNKIKTSNLTPYKWIEYAKGGTFRRWYGNIEHIVDWSNDAISHYKANKVSRIISEKLWFKKGISWSDISTGNNYGFRFNQGNGTFDSVGYTVFMKENKSINYFIGFLNSKNVFLFLNIINPTHHILMKDVRNLPIVFPKQDSIKEQIEALTQQNIDISKEEWDSRETSWDFSQNELIRIAKSMHSHAERGNETACVERGNEATLETVYKRYCEEWREKFFQLHTNEEELNRLFIDIYELQDELTPDVELKDITILKNETKIIEGELVFQADEIMKQFISYGVGVMFGRYSLDSEGLCIANLGSEALASQMSDETKVSFPIDDDNVIPVLEDEYFSDDIVSRFVAFVKATFGEENLSKNILFIEESLGTTLRKYFVKGFYEDHLKRYKKRPIYWMVSSPKKSFNALIYMHRYEADIFARVQNSYLREYITKLEATKQTLHVVSEDESNSATERRKATKEIDNITKKVDEIIKYDRDHLTAFAQGKIEIDLDDGVKVNYCKFKDILYPISGLCK